MTTAVMFANTHCCPSTIQATGINERTPISIETIFCTTSSTRSHRNKPSSIHVREMHYSISRHWLDYSFRLLKLLLIGIVWKCFNIVTSHEWNDQLIWRSSFLKLFSQEMLQILARGKVIIIEEEEETPIKEKKKLPSLFKKGNLLLVVGGERRGKERRKLLLLLIIRKKKIMARMKRMTSTTRRVIILILLFLIQFWWSSSLAGSCYIIIIV